MTCDHSEVLKFKIWIRTRLSFGHSWSVPPNAPFTSFSRSLARTAWNANAGKVFSQSRFFDFVSIHTYVSLNSLKFEGKFIWILNFEFWIQTLVSRVQSNRSQMNPFGHLTASGSHYCRAMWQQCGCFSRFTVWPRGPFWCRVMCVHLNSFTNS